MFYPIWVANTDVQFQSALVLRNHFGVWRMEEGRTGPVYAFPRETRHIDPLTRPESAKPASSQGGALALEICEQTPIQHQLKDMKMELYS
jgi:hypothetical protein